MVITASALQDLKEPPVMRKLMNVKVSRVLTRLAVRLVHTADLFLTTLAGLCNQYAAQARLFGMLLISDALKSTGILVEASNASGRVLVSFVSFKIIKAL